jgi:hypothetical protein
MKIIQENDIVVAVISESRTQLEYPVAGKAARSVSIEALAYISSWSIHLS